MPNLTPNDCITLDNLAIENLQSEFPCLKLCKIRMDAGQILVIECWESTMLDIVQDILRVLEHRVWETTGALEIVGMLEGSLEFQVKTRRRIAGSDQNRLRFQNNLSECAFFLMQTILEPTTTLETAPPVEETLVYQEDLEKILESIGWDAERTRSAIQFSGIQRYKVGDRLLFPTMAGVQLVMEAAERAQMVLLGKIPATTIEQTERSATMPTRRISARRVKSPTSIFSTLTVNGANYRLTINTVLELMAPGNLEEQRNLAKGMLGLDDNYTNLFTEYTKAGKQPGKAEEGLKKHLKAFLEDTKPAVKAE